MGEAEQKSSTWSRAVSSPSSFPPAEFEVTTRITRIGEDAFKSDGKVLREPGWLAVYGKKAAEEQGEDEPGKSSSPVTPGEKARTEQIEAPRAADQAAAALQ